MGFAIYWPESALDIHVFPILKPPSHLPPHPISQGHPNAPALMKASKFMTWRNSQERVLWEPPQQVNWLLCPHSTSPPGYPMMGRLTPGLQSRPCTCPHPNSADSAWVNGQVTSPGLSFPTCKMKSWDKAHDFINKHKHQRKKENNRGTACAADTHMLLTWKRYQKFSKATVWLGCRQGLFPPFREKSWPLSYGTLHSWSPFLLCGTFLVSDSFSAIFFYIYIENRHFILFVQGRISKYKFYNMQI